MSNQFIPIERDQPVVIPVQEWLAEDHLARFIVEIVESLDVTPLEAAYRGGGSAPYPPKMMLALLFYGYATGIFSSRALEQATYELIPVIYITGNTHPDHNSINTFRKRFLGELKGLFVQILLRAYALGVLQLGNVSLDGSKVHANASKHKAMSWDYANRLEEQLQVEVEALLQQAEAGHTEPLPGLKVADEVALRQAQLQQIGAVKAELEARAQARYEQEQAAYEAKLAQRRAKEQARGRQLGGRPPQPPEPGPQGKDQVNFTDSDSQIMPVSGGGGFEQAYNAQAGVEHNSRLIVENHLSPNPNDKQELQPALDNLSQLPKELGQVNHALTDNGYFSEANVKACEQAGIIPLIATGRAGHHPTLEERFADPGEAPDTADPVAQMQHRLRTPEGKALYAKRKSTVEPVFGIIKHVMGFRQFLLRGLQAVQGEWNLVCIAYNLKRLHVLAG
jgi:transposase